MKSFHPHIEKAPTGIEGFDEMSGGGLPRARTTLVAGGLGTGKTVFALQTLVNGAVENNEPGIFVAFEENSRQVIANASSFGWDLQALEDRKLFFLDARIGMEVIQGGRFNLQGMLSGLRAKIEEMGARRIVFDSVDILLSLLNDPMAERAELYRLHHWLQEMDLVGLVTAKLDGLGAPASAAVGLRYFTVLQFMADCVVELQHQVEDHASLRYLRILKYRGSDFAEGEMPLLIGPNGIEVASLDRGQFDYPVSDERVSTGVPGLNDMLTGGYYSGSSVLITGSPGTAKSTLCGAFGTAACRREERVLMVLFDEGTAEMVRNLTSVNLHLDRHRESGLLRIVSVRSEARSAEAQLLRIRSMVEEFEPHCLVIDPLSAIIKGGNRVEARQVSERLFYTIKGKGITSVCSSLLENSGVEVEGSALEVSTIADTWLHLSYLVQGGERNRALSIVKSRGTAHSRQVSELLLSDQGIALEDVYTAEGEVLMGTLRWEKERQERQARQAQQQELEQRRRVLAAGQAEVAGRIEALQAEHERHRVELEQLDQEQERLVKQWQTNEAARKDFRSIKSEEK